MSETTCLMCGKPVGDEREDFCDECFADPRVVIHLDESGEISVFADEEVTVFWVDERAPNDRVYQMDRHPIPDGMLNGVIGRHKDGTSADARAHAIVAQFEGRPHLSAVVPDTEG